MAYYRLTYGNYDPICVFAYGLAPILGKINQLSLYEAKSLVNKDGESQFDVAFNPDEDTEIILVPIQEVMGEIMKQISIIISPTEETPLIFNAPDPEIGDDHYIKIYFMDGKLQKSMIGVLDSEIESCIINYAMAEWMSRSQKPQATQLYVQKYQKNLEDMRNTVMHNNDKNTRPKLKARFI